MSTSMCEYVFTKKCMWKQKRTLRILYLVIRRNLVFGNENICSQKKYIILLTYHLISYTNTFLLQTMNEYHTCSYVLICDIPQIISSILLFSSFLTKIHLKMFIVQTIGNVEIMTIDTNNHPMIYFPLSIQLIPLMLIETIWSFR